MIEFEDLYAQMEKYVWWLSNRTARKYPDASLMNEDDIAGELFLELWKGYVRYKSKPMGQLQAIIRKMLDNRVSELVYRFYVTHRSVENAMMHLIPGSPDNPKPYRDGADEISEDVIPDFSSDPATLYASVERIRTVRSNLSEQDTEIFDAVLDGDPRIMAQIELSMLRATTVYKNGGSVKIKPHHVARALCIPERQVRESFNHVKNTFAEEIACD